jgi:hypothetical protein
MGVGGVICEALAEDEALVGLLVGGIYAYEQIGRNGMSRVTTPEAYDANGFLKPCAVVKVGEARVGSALRDDRGGVRQRVEVYLYADGDSGYETIREARDVVVAALDRRWVDGAGYVRQVGGAEDMRDAKLNNAALVRVDFEVTK